MATSTQRHNGDESSAEVRGGTDEMGRTHKPATIIRAPKNRENPYTMVRRATFEDERLSWEERGILGYLLVKPNDWEIDVSNLWHAGNVGRDKIYRMLAHLEKVGYLEREVIRERGQFARIRYLLHEEPLPENQEMATRVTPFPEIPDTVNQEQTNKYSISNNEQRTKNEELGIVGATPTPPLGDWQAYLDALCWICHGHQKTSSLTEAQLGALTAEAKKIRDDGYSKEELRDWWLKVWRNDWRWDKGRQRPRPDEVRSSIPILRADDADRRSEYAAYNYLLEPLDDEAQP